MTLKHFATLLLAAGVFSCAYPKDETCSLSMPDGTTMQVVYYGDNIVRLFHDPQGGEIRDPEANPPAIITVPDAKKPLTHPRIAVSVKKDGTIRVKAGCRTLLKGKLEYEEGKTVLRCCDGGPYRYYGGGVQNGRFAHAGKSIAIENQNSWTDGGVSSPAPWFWSTGGYGILWNTFSKGVYTFGDEIELSHDTPYLDIFVMADDAPADLLRDYYQLTGNPVLLPKFGFYEGHLNAYNRDYWKASPDGILFEDGKRYRESQTPVAGGIRESLNGELKGNYQFSARAVVDRYEAADMPLGWVLPNDGYGAGYGQTSTLDGNIENLKDFGDYARSKGVEIGLWTQSDLHPVEGIPALLQRDIEKEVGVAGVRVLKTDVAWVGWGYSFGLNGIADAAGIMAPFARPFIITLDGWAGTQRYGGIWTGDQTGGQWEYIRFHIPTYIGAGLSGQPNVGSDMDGIFGGRNEWVNIRDFQWKTFTPMELNMDGWGANEKYPQALGSRAADINRAFLKLKSVLMPYTYSIAAEAVTGLPMIRAISLEYPSSPDCITPYEYLYGPSLLVAPVYKETAPDSDGNDIRNDIYLPDGEWYDFFTGKAYSGGCVLNSYPAPIDRIPVFVKKGAIIPVTEPHNNPSQVPSDLREYLIYPGNGSFTEYDDDGRSCAYLNGAYATTRIEQSLSGGSLEVRLGAASGSFDGMVPEKKTVLKVLTSAAPASVTASVDVESVEYAEGFALIRLASADITAADVVVKISGLKAPAAGLLCQGRATRESEAPFAVLTASSVTLNWPSAAAEGTYRELEFNGIRYTNICGESFIIEGLEPDTEYVLKARDWEGKWVKLNVKTDKDPLENAVKGITATCTAPSQPGQELENLFDCSVATEMWHTDWALRAIPFDITANLGAIFQLDKLEYVPRSDAGNGTIYMGSVSISEDGVNWTDPVSFQWERDPQSKFMQFDGAKAQYVKLHVDYATGAFGSGRELFIYKLPGSQGYKHGVFNEKGEAVESL